MAPEQAAGAPVDVRTDQYAFALTLFDALLGQVPPHRAASPADPSALVRVEVAPHVRAAVERALSAEPAARFASMDELLNALAPHRRRGRWIVPAIAGGSVAVAAVVVATSRGTSACEATSPAEWTGARARVVAALASRPGPFAPWAAEQLAAAVDRAVDSDGQLERAVCTSGGDPACAAHRQAALHGAVAHLAADDEPWWLVHGLDRCDELADQHRVEANGLRRELAANPPRARVAGIAARADAIAAPDLAADAHEAAARAALADGDAKAADAELHTQESLGERVGDDRIRGRALLHLLEVDRFSADHAAAVRDDDALRAMLDRHGQASHEVHVVAAVEAEVFTDLDDRARAIAAWDRASATAAGDADAELAARVGHGWARYALSGDAATARREIADAVTAARAATAAARREAERRLGDLALETGDAVAATAAFDVRDGVRHARARGLAGDVDGALAEVDAVTTDIFRRAIARAQILHAAKRTRDAYDTLRPVMSAIRGPTFPGPPDSKLSVPDRLRAMLVVCELEVELDLPGACNNAERLAAGLPADAYTRARIALGRARASESQHLSYLTDRERTRALGILVAANAPAPMIAEVRWQLARGILSSPAERRQYAVAARAAFVAANRTDDVAAIDGWLATQP
jgi:hypothetical protein